jgi:hypothetical protein
MPKKLNEMNFFKCEELEYCFGGHTDIGRKLMFFVYVMHPAE